MRRIRIAHVITRLIVGGAQENTLYTVEGLSRSGRYDVTLVTGPPLGPEGSLLEGPWRDSVRTIIEPQMCRAVNPIRDALTYRRLRRLFRRERFDIVHTHSSKAGVLARLAARREGVPIILHTIHGLPFHPYQNRLTNAFYVWLERKAAAVSDRIVCVADAMADAAVRAGVAALDKFVTIYSGIEVEAFAAARSTREAARRRLGLPPDALVVGKIARLFYLKGHEYVLEAAERIVQEVPNVRFLLVGDGILRERFERDLGRCGLRDRFVFAGLVPPEQIPEMVAAMDVLVHASLREGLPKAVAQALAGGKPAVAFDLDGAREVIRDGETGFLVAAEDADALADRTIRLLKDPALRAKMGEAGKRLVAARFRKETMVERLMALYEELLRAKGMETTDVRVAAR